MRRSMIALVVVGGLVAALAGLAVAQSETATLKLTDGSVAAGLGFSWGKGTLTYAGKTYPVKIEGLSVGEVGLSRATAVGTVSNLKNVSDFSGNYVAAGAGATAAGPAAACAAEEIASHRAETIAEPLAESRIASPSPSRPLPDPNVVHYFGRGS